MTTGQRDSPLSLLRSPTEFPTLKLDSLSAEEAVSDHQTTSPLGTFNFPQAANGAAREHQWHPRNARVSFLNSLSTRRNRQKSLSEAWQNIRRRRGSVSENAKEIGEALKAPVSFRLVLLCSLWFMTSILSNASSKSILIAFRKPVTLTVVQFFFVSSWCLISSVVAQRFSAVRKAIPVLRYPIQPPSRELIRATLPLTAFQIGGHILNSDAMSRIPVSLVHTIKGLSPLLTVVAYRIFFHVHYSIPTYLSLVPLTLGVVLACSANISGDLIGLLNAFGSAVLFVTQNIVSKKLFNESARAESEGFSTASIPAKPDKLNLLCYSSGLAFLLTFPLWLWSDGVVLINDLISRGTVPLSARPDALDHGRLTLEFIFNGTFHFTQSLVAFILLSLVTPVTYSVASLIKRVFVICFAIVWFGNPVTNVQAAGICLTFVGLYLYDRTNDAARADKRARALQARETSLLPLIKEDAKADDPVLTHAPLGLMGRSGELNALMGQKRGRTRDWNLGTRSPRGGKRRASNDPESSGRSSPGEDTWLPPGTKQESTWVSQDGLAQPNGVHA